MASSKTFTFNNKSSTNYFLVNKIKRPYLPPLAVPSIKIPNRAGEIAIKRNEIGSIDFEIDITLMGFDQNEAREKARDLASFLIYDDVKELIFSDEPDKKYFARFNSTGTDLEEIAYLGEGTIVFTAFDPFAYALYENSMLTQEINANLIPNHLFILTDPETYTDWYSVMALSTEENNTILRAEMVAIETNPRMRLMMDSSNRATLVNGKTYNFSFKILPSVKLKTLEYTNYIAYNPDGTYEWKNHGEPVDLVNLPVDENGYYTYSSSFVADRDGEVRMGFGFGAFTNTEMDNGTWFRLKEVKLEEGTTRTPVNNEPTIYTNNGTAPLYPRIRIVPTVQSEYVKITNLTNNKSITYNAVLPAWSILIIDCDTNQVYLESTGESLIKNIALDSEFFPLEVGENKIIVENEDFTGVELAGQVRLYWRERFY